jgi:hypothetical protein
MSLVLCLHGYMGWGMGGYLSIHLFRLILCDSESVFLLYNNDASS